MRSIKILNWTEFSLSKTKNKLDKTMKRMKIKRQ